jgi:hypothetical protein
LEAEKMQIDIDVVNWEIQNEDPLFEVSTTDGEVLAVVDAQEVQDIVSWGFVHEGQILWLKD